MLHIPCVHHQPSHLNPAARAHQPVAAASPPGNFVKLIMGQLGPQQAFLMRKLKISGSMALAMKLQPILDAAAPKAKM